MKTIILSLSLILIMSVPCFADEVVHFEYEACYADVPIRKTPDADSEQTGVIPEGERVRVSDQEGYWVKVVYKDDEGNYYVGWSACTGMCPKGWTVDKYGEECY